MTFTITPIKVVNVSITPGTFLVSFGDPSILPSSLGSP